MKPDVDVKSLLFKLFDRKISLFDLGKTPIFLTEASLAFFLYYLSEKEKKNLFVITLDDSLAERLYFEFDRPKTSIFLRENAVLPWEEGRTEKGNVEPYFKLKNLAESGSIFTVFSSVNQALLTFPWDFPPPLELKVNFSYDRDELIEKLQEFGYERNYLVEKEGEYAVRGSLIDIYPVDFRPVRLDFLGETLESIKTFSLVTQRSTQTLKEVTIFPYKLGFLGKVERSELDKLVGKAPEEELRLLSQGKTFAGWGVYWPYLFKLRSLGDICSPEKSLFVLVEEELIKERSKAHTSWLIKSWERSAGKRSLPFPNKNRSFVNLKDLLQGQNCVSISLLRDEKITLPLKLPFQTSERLKELKSWLNKGFKVVLAGKEKYRFRLERKLKEIDLCLSSEFGNSGGLFFLPFNLAQSFVFREGNVICASLSELFSFPYRSKEVVQERPFFSSFDIQPGDLVVHSRYGIGKYMGMEKVYLDGAYHDYLVIEYADGKLKIRPENFSDLSCYYGGEEGDVKLSSLSSREWQRKKEKARRAARKLAINLLKLYARRKILSGHSFSPDTPWQVELEESFPYEETEDQRRAVEEVKKDMESPKAMDRLVFGDVGFGKTEVAIRASFKAVMDGFQVMVLVPTTVLAEQHKRTFQERLSTFPLRVEAVSRLLSKKEQQKILKDFSLGKVDILIGTHRLLSSDVKPRRLGLLIIDEEHRFGVEQKEKIKDKYPRVDVLSLSATPIPRTLQMALSGVREVSLIETPPAYRLPVATFVEPYDLNLVKLAIQRELNRNGQVFYLHNKIDELDEIAQNLQKIFPEARLTVVHGELNQDELELAMWGFSQGEYDIMVCTTIIEAGLDFSRANTLIVDDSERLGLAQIYQLRGRVGRSERQAYAYFLYNPASLTPAGWERLKAVAELSDLGSGFRLALKDLEIRGAGNLFGPEQHGHIKAVGFELYTQMIEEAVRELKGEAFKPPAVVLDLGLPAYVPESYLPDERLRLEVYHRLAEIRDEAEISKLAEELFDRFGTIPLEVQNLFEVVKIRLWAQRMGIKEVKVKKEGIILKVSDVGRIIEVVPSCYTYRKSFNNLILDCPFSSNEEKVAYLKSFLNDIMQAVMKVG